MNPTEKESILTLALMAVNLFVVGYLQPMSR